MLTLYAVEYSGEEQCYQHTVLVEYDKVPKDYKTWRQDDFFDTFLMKNARKPPYFNAGMDRTKLT